MSPRNAGTSPLTLERSVLSNEPGSSTKDLGE